MPDAGLVKPKYTETLHLASRFRLHPPEVVLIKPNLFMEVSLFRATPRSSRVH